MKTRARLSQQYSAGKSNITVTNLEKNNEYWERWNTACFTNARKISRCKTVLFQNFLCLFIFFFPFMRIKTNLNNCEGSHAFHIYMSHFYSSNDLVNNREKVFFRLVGDPTVPVPNIQIICRRDQAAVLTSLSQQSSSALKISAATEPGFSSLPSSDGFVLPSEGVKGC